MKHAACSMLLLAVAQTASAEVIENLDHIDYTATPRRGQTLRQALDAASPIREEGKLYHGYTKWHVRWNFRWWREADGRCRITEVTTHLDLDITLPELEGGTPAMQERFARFREALSEHEDGHAQIARDAAESVDQDILDLPEMASCELLEETANQLGHEHLDAAGRKSKRYDRDTEHGRSQGASPD